MSRDQQIIDAVFARLETITTANGYQTDAGKRVVHEPFIPDEQRDVFPLLSLGDSEETVQVGTDLSEDMDGFDLTPNVYGYALVPIGQDPGPIARELIRDIKNAVCDPTQDRRIPDANGVNLLNDNIMPVERIIEYPNSGSNLVSVRITFSAPYLELYGQTS